MFILARLILTKKAFKIYLLIFEKKNYVRNHRHVELFYSQCFNNKCNNINKNKAPLYIFYSIILLFYYKRVGKIEKE